MKKSHTVLGIDLAGCMSGNSAYLYADISEDAIEIIDAFKEPKHKEHTACETFLRDALKRRRIDAVAVDAPLSLPLPLIDPSAPSLPRKGSGEILNPYLYRYTDYYLYKAFGLRPMPPAGDRIGRLTARAVALLQRFGYDFPNLRINGKSLPIYEVYPKQIARSLGLADYKKEPAQLSAALGVSLKGFDEHLIDALLCAYGGYKVLQGETVQPPEGVEKEGWCFPVI